mmetsp:Transcript_17789/g.42762  ORF Transcript_17789/g.42762 Transcript_17789/m.42762 type:complete len:80 (-) Transcript_17789:942-1181(-)
MHPPPQRHKKVTSRQISPPSLQMGQRDTDNERRDLVAAGGAAEQRCIHPLGASNALHTITHSHHLDSQLLMAAWVQGWV